MSEHSLKADVHTRLSRWHEKEKAAAELIKLVGDLIFDKGVECVLFRRDIYDSRPSKVIDDHGLAKRYVKQAINVEDSLQLAAAIYSMDNIVPSKIDLGRLATEWITEGSDYSNVKEFVHYKLRDFKDTDFVQAESRDLVLYGFGRIGRLIARRVISTTGRGDQLRLRAIVVRPKLKDRYEEIKKRMSLLHDDTVHGPFPGNLEIDLEDSSVTINGNKICFIFANDPEDVDYTTYGIQDALLIDNTGVWRDEKGLSKHLRPGIKNVLLTAPGKDVANIVYGVNHHMYDPDKTPILSAASCTTNAIVPIIKLMEETLGIDKGHIETIHAYTSDQNLLDNFHKKPRRGRGAATNMVLTTTGAASAVSKVIPHLKGKLTGNAVRVPTPDVSLAIISLNVKEATSVEEINDLMRSAALSGSLVEQIHYSQSTEYVSSHAIGMTSTSVFDAPSTKVSADGKTVTIYAWYDNEYGYCCQVVRLAKHVTNVRRKAYF